MWTPDWPTKPGWYWGFGKYRGLHQQTKLETVQVVQVGNGVVHISHGTVIYKSEWVGMFKPMDVPDLPSVETIEILESEK